MVTEAASTPEASSEFEYGPWPDQNRFVDGLWPIGLPGSIPGPGVVFPRIKSTFVQAMDRPNYSKSIIIFGSTGSTLGVSNAISTV